MPTPTLAVHGPLPLEHFLHRVAALLHDPQLHKHDPDLLSRAAVARRADGRRWQHLVELSKMWNCVKHPPEPIGKLTETLTAS